MKAAVTDHVWSLDQLDEIVGSKFDAACRRFRRLTMKLVVGVPRGRCGATTRIGGVEVSAPSIRAEQNLRRGVSHRGS
jgi:hypothetical protein